MSDILDSQPGGASPSRPASPAAELAAATPESPLAVAARLLGPLTYRTSSGPGLDIVALDLADGGTLWVDDWTREPGRLGLVRYLACDVDHDGWPGEMLDIGYGECDPSDVVAEVLRMLAEGQPTLPVAERPYVMPEPEAAPCDCCSTAEQSARVHPHGEGVHHRGSRA